MQNNPTDKGTRVTLKVMPPIFIMLVAASTGWTVIIIINNLFCIVQIAVELLYSKMVSDMKVKTKQTFLKQLLNIYRDQTMDMSTGSG